MDLSEDKKTPSIRTYPGQSRYGPCTFYYFPQSHTWLVRCRSRVKSRDLPLVVQHPEVCEFLDAEPLLRRALGHPTMFKPPAYPSADDHPDHVAMRKCTFMPLYSDSVFQRKQLQVGDQVHFAKLRNSTDVQGVMSVLSLQMFASNGNWMWVAWRDLREISKDFFPCICDDVKDHILFPLTDLARATGYTGFWKANPRIESDKPGHHWRVSCAKNPSFWAECFF